MPRHFFQSLPHHSSPNSAKGPLAHVQGQIVAVLGSGGDTDGAEHQHFRLRVDWVLSMQGSNADITGQTLFVAVRYGDAEGLPRPILGLAAGQPMEAQGEYIDAMRAEPGPDNDDPILPVLHFTHHPVGFIVYQGQTYE